MSAFGEFTTKCHKCGKKYKTFGQICYLTLDKHLFIGSLCKGCRVKLRKLVKEFLRC